MFSLHHSNISAPRLILDLSINCSISSKSGKVNPSVLVRGKKSYDMNVTLILQKKNGTSWTNVTKWTAHSYGTRMEINKWFFRIFTYYGRKII